jgi:hypothetical protein
MNNKLYTVYSVQIRETGDILGIFDCEEDAMEEIERQEQKGGMKYKKMKKWTASKTLKKKC